MQAPGVALEIAVAGDDAMARHDDGDRVGPDGRSHINRCARIEKPEQAAERPVGRGLPYRDATQSRPDISLQIRAGNGNVDAVERLDIATEVTADRIRDCGRCRAAGQLTRS
jgi:hypothetical protein